MKLEGDVLGRASHVLSVRSHVWPVAAVWGSVAMGSSLDLAGESCNMSQGQLSRGTCVDQTRLPPGVVRRGGRKGSPPPLGGTDLSVPSG